MQTVFFYENVVNDFWRCPGCPRQFWQNRPNQIVECLPAVMRTSRKTQKILCASFFCCSNFLYIPCKHEPKYCVFGFIKRATEHGQYSPDIHGSDWVWRPVGFCRHCCLRLVYAHRPRHQIVHEVSTSLLVTFLCHMMLFSTSSFPFQYCAIVSSSSF